MTNPNCTELVFVIDRSGSMKTIADDMIGGFNTLVENQKLNPGDCNVTIVKFDNEYSVVCEATPIMFIEKFELVPRGMTSLFDAIGKTIASTGERISKLPEDLRPGKVLFVIITDGFDNASREYSQLQIYEMISHQREVYNWEFIFLGANQDSVTTAKELGISVNNAVKFDQTVTGSRGLMKGLDVVLSSYRVSPSARNDSLFDQAKYDSIVRKLVMYTEVEVREIINLNREKLFSAWSENRPENWKCDSRTSDLVCIANWLNEQMLIMKLDDLGRITQNNQFHRRSRSEDNLWALACNIMNDALIDKIDRHRRPHRRWG